MPHHKNSLFALVALFVMAFAAAPAHADAIPLVPPFGSPSSGGTTIQFTGAEGTEVDSPYTVTAGGNAVTFSQQVGFPQTDGTFSRAFRFVRQTDAAGQNGQFFGNFLPGTLLLDTNASTSGGLGPINISLSIGVTEIGFQVQDGALVLDPPGAPQFFSASVFNGDTLLSTFVFTGFSSNAADGSATFVGFRARNGDVITRLVLASASNDFAVGPVTFGPANVTGAGPIPEPATIALLTTGLIGVATKIRRRRNGERRD